MVDKGLKTYPSSPNLTYFKDWLHGNPEINDDEVAKMLDDVTGLEFEVVNPLEVKPPQSPIEASDPGDGVGDMQLQARDDFEGQSGVVFIEE